MLNTISSRSTFYDLTGYLIPGILSLGLIWMYWYFVGDCQSALEFLKVLRKIGVFFTTFGVVVVGYAIGHLINSISSWLYERVLFRTGFLSWRNWVSRMSESRLTRANETAMIEYRVDASALKAFDIRVRMENKMPNAAVTGLCFLSYYGMCRTLSFLSLLAVPLVSILCFSDYDLCVFSPILPFCASIFFGYQYSRFVIYYYDFLGSTLLLQCDISTTNTLSYNKPKKHGEGKNII